ncbi:FAD-dependent oxidoreductase [Natronorubrum tibetense]|uniref:Oxidoreductase FAD-binding domain-containing protein n=1 Tax=Natronorubrum tibetense GA33 TaxID=1114856 RepID=L9WA29_9EURY|nr:FAD-dependent oxidoreductase [Natronorubrum tibetense]ELY46227.1 Oxidoreductase FAD-binding domain-containing protein [Natronorubrum tibetense GA33]
MTIEGTPVTVESVREVGPGTVALELETPEGFDALPGQFVLLRAVPGAENQTSGDHDEDDIVMRHYTLSSPAVGETFEITVGIDPDGDLSPWLADLEGGETVHIEGPFGTITYEGDEDVVAVAGGPGVGPAVSIAQAAHESGHDAVVVYQDDEPAHVDRLEALEDAGADVVILEADDSDGLAEAIESHRTDGQLYAFGFEDFVRFVADTIDEDGGDSDEALIENFG